MGLDYILRNVSAFYGASNLDTNIEIRALLVDIINKAAEEIWKTTDLPGCLREVYVQTNPGDEIAMPPFIGSVRAMRDTTWKEPWPIFDMRPRFHDNWWVNAWKNFRFKYFSPIKRQITNAAMPRASIEVIDSDVKVTLVGSTLVSNRISETVTMDAVNKQFANTFISYDSIQKNIVSDHNVIINDADGIELATIYNDQLESQYQIFDVSDYPWGYEVNTRVMEVVYKMRLPKLQTDTDVFPVSGFDDAIIQKAKQLITEDRPGDENRAILMEQKTNKLVKNSMQDVDRTFRKKIRFAKNPLLGRFHANRYFGGNYYP